LSRVVMQVVRLRHVVDPFIRNGDCHSWAHISLRDTGGAIQSRAFHQPAETADCLIGPQSRFLTGLPRDGLPMGVLLFAITTEP
jgi:hypothetical protein